MRTRDQATAAIERARRWLARRTAVEQRLLRWATVGFAVVATCGLVLAKLLDDVMDNEDVAQLDPRLLARVERLRTPWLTSVMRGVTHLGGGWAVAIVTGTTAAALVVRHRPRLASLVVLSVTGTALLTTVAKAAIDRPRPPAANALAPFTGAAFPSGHAAQSIACYGAVAAAITLAAGSRRRWPSVLATTVIALLIGASRVYLGVHWPSDVVSGWALAAAWLTVLLVAGGPGWAYWRARRPRSAA